MSQAPAKLGFFARYLTLWVALCIVVGIALGHAFPAPFQTLGALELAQVNLPVAVLVWLMIVPMLLKIDMGATPKRPVKEYTLNETRYRMVEKLDPKRFERLQKEAQRDATRRMEIYRQMAEIRVNPDQGEQ